MIEEISITRREFMKYVAVGCAVAIGTSFLGCMKKEDVVKQEIQKNIYRDEFILGYGKDHKLKGGIWGIGFFPKTHVLERLVEYDLKRDEYIPSLAEKWELENDGKAIVFELKKGIKFSSGEEFNAEAVKFSVEWLKQNHPLGKETFEGAEVIDEHTVLINYKEAKFLNLAKMAEFHMGIMSPNSVSPAGDPKGKFVYPIGTGPFKVVDYKEEQYAVYEPNTYWYERMGIKPKFKRFIVKIIKDEDTRVMALRSGEVDAISDYSHGGSDYTPRNMLNVLKREGFKVYKRIIPLTWIVAFNYEREPFNDVKIREIVDLSVNRDEIVKIFDNQVLPAKTLFIEEAPGIREANCIYKYDPEVARALAEELGIKGTKASMIIEREQGDQILVGQLIQQQLKNVGIDVELNVLESGAYKERRDSGDYDMRIYYIGGTDRRFYLRMFWRFHPKTKWKVYVSERTGELCDRILTEYDKNKRKHYLIEFYKAVYEEHGVVPLYFDIMTVVASQKVDVEYGELFRYAEPMFHSVGVRI